MVDILFLTWPVWPVCERGVPDSMSREYHDAARGVKKNLGKTVERSETKKIRRIGHSCGAWRERSDRKKTTAAAAAAAGRRAASSSRRRRQSQRRRRRRRRRRA